MHKLLRMILPLLAMMLSSAMYGQKKAKTYFKEGLAAIEKKEIDTAIARFTEAIYLDPVYKDAFLGRGLAYLGQGKLGDSLKEQNRYQDAIKDFTEVIRLDSTFSVAYSYRGLAYNQKLKYDLAIADLTTAIRICSKSDKPDAYDFRADAYHEQKRFELEIADLTEAIKLAPKKDLTYFYNKRGNAHYALKDKEHNEQAILDYTQAVKLDPGFGVGFYNRARAYVFKQQYDLAIRDFEEAIRINPEDGDPYRGKAKAYEEKEEFDLAIREYTQAIRVDAEDPKGYNDRGVFYKKRGQYDLAIRDFDSAIIIKPSYGAPYINIIDPLVRAGQFIKANEYYTRYLAQKLPNNMESEDNKFYKFYIAAVTENIPNNQYDKALANLNTAANVYGTEIKKTTQSKFVNVIALKGYTLEKLGRLKEAVDIYNQALSINPLQPDVEKAMAAINKKIVDMALNDKTPPDIKLLSPQPSRSFDIEADKAVTQITGRAEDESGVANIKINGKPVDKMEEDGLFISGLVLKKGANTITITATDKQGNTSTKKFTLTGVIAAKKASTELDIPDISPSAVPKYYAILIAEKDYIDNSIPDLQNPVNDARELEAILKTQYTFSTNNIDTLYNSSREDIMQAIVQRCNSLTENDNLVIFYAGHGTAEKDKFGDLDGYWIPISAKKGVTSSYISAEDINKALKHSNAKHILVIADACFSGAFTRDMGKEAPKSIQKQYKVASRKVMASGNLEPVPDNSRFLYYLKKSLKENTAKYVSAKKIFDSFYDAILNNTENLPQYAAIKNVGDEGGEFVFIKK